MSLQIHPNITSTSCCFVHRTKLPGHSLFGDTACHSQFDLWLGETQTCTFLVLRFLPALSVLEWSAVGDSRQKDTGGFWQTGWWCWVSFRCHQSIVSARQPAHITPESRIRHSFSTIMAITDFLAASDITSAINACKGQEAAVFLMSVKERKKGKCCFQEDVRAFNVMMPFKRNRIHLFMSVICLQQRIPSVPTSFSKQLVYRRKRRQR